MHGQRPRRGGGSLAHLPALLDTKEEAVLGALDPKGELIARRPAGAPGTRGHLGRAAPEPGPPHRRVPPGPCRITQPRPPHRPEHRAAQRPSRQAATLAGPAGRRDRRTPRRRRGNRSLRPAVYAAATLEALQIATSQWVASDGQLDLIALVDEAAGLLKPGQPRRRAEELGTRGGRPATDHQRRAGNVRGQVEPPVVRDESPLFRTTGGYFPAQGICCLAASDCRRNCDAGYWGCAMGH